MYSGRSLEWVMDSVVGLTYALITVGVILYSVFAMRTQTACLSAGYPDWRISWDATGYCVRRVEQTDIVVPVEQVKR